MNDICEPCSQLMSGQDFPLVQKLSAVPVQSGHNTVISKTEEQFVNRIYMYYDVVDATSYEIQLNTLKQ